MAISIERQKQRKGMHMFMLQGIKHRVPTSWTVVFKRGELFPDNLLAEVVPIPVSRGHDLAQPTIL
jgi:hypothetical protein